MSLFRKKNRIKPLPKPKPAKAQAKKTPSAKRRSWFSRETKPRPASTRQKKTSPPRARREPRAPREIRFPKPTPPAQAWGYQDAVCLLVLLAVCAVLFFSAPGFRSLWETDEARYAEIPREMVLSGDWVTPTLNHVKYFEKPPLAYWLVAVSYKLFGISGASARLAPAACGTLVALLVFLLGRSQAGAKAGLWAGLTLVTSLMFFGLSRILMTDMALCLGVALAMYGAWQTRLGYRHGPYAFWLGCAAGFLSKGLLGPGLPIMATVVFALAAREWRLLVWLANWRALVMFAALCAPWVVLVSWRNPGFFTYFFIDEHLGRLLTARHQRYEPPWYYAALLPAAMFPWIALMPWALIRTWPGGLWRQEEQRAWLFAALWFASFFLFLSISSSKMMHYILPALPALALLLGQALAGVSRDGWRSWAPPGLRASLTALALAMLAVGAGLALLPALWPEITYEQAGQLTLWGPMAAAAVGIGIFVLRARLWSVLASPLLVFFLVVTAAALAAPRLNDYRSVEGLVKPIRQQLRPADYLVSYGDYFQGLPFYSGGRVIVVRNWGELDHGKNLAPSSEAARWFLPDDEAFARLLQQPRARVIALAETAAFERLREKMKGVPGVLLFEWVKLGDKTLFSNRPR
ncbi:hypothetical protein AAU61_14755 [Desulfocarbo indianensis]|nr:hypothetical protein AAU61_14755 [Desulfocarbo indianensis]